MQTNFRRNLIIGFAISFVLLLVSSISSYVSINNLISSINLVNHTNDVIKKLENVISILKDAETGQRGFLLTGDDRFLEPYNGAYQKAIDVTDQIKSLTTESSEQQADCDLMHRLIDRRLYMLDSLITLRRNNEIISKETMLMGKLYMDSARKIVNAMETREQVTLQHRVSSLNRFAGYTPVIIVIAAILALLVTIISFLRIMNDYGERVALQRELEQKDHDISARLNIVREVAERVSSGDYKTRISDESRDVLGGISNSLNRMAAALDKSFTQLSENEWLQKGTAMLNEKMIGEKNLGQLTTKIINFVTDYTHAIGGAIYLAGNSNNLTLSSSVAIERKGNMNDIVFGTGTIGMAASTGKRAIIDDLSSEDIYVSFSAGKIKPRHLLVEPIFFEGRLVGVIEILSLTDFDTVSQQFYTNVAYNSGIAINSAVNHNRLEELLAETEAQAEELQAQHRELENINAELETQAEKLQASEEELKVQQEELQQSNQELEERSRMLEEKNQMIVERNAEIQNKAEQLAVTTRYKSEFMANMSHELRTPLNSILLLSRLIAENPQKNLSDNQVEYAKVIQSSGNGLLRLIDEILDLSRIESGKMSLEFQDVHVDEVAEGLKAIFEPIAAEKKIQFVVTKAADVPEKIETDRLRLEQILRNLISNAIKFTDSGSVSLSINGDGHTISFTVSDTGIGIPEDKQQIIFEAFQQADGSTKRKYGGTGLGLSISRELAKLLNGEIKLNSREGEGSQFTLVIPVVRNKEFVAEKQPLFSPGYFEEVPKEAEKKETPRISQPDIPASVPDDRGNIEKHDKAILIVEDDVPFAKSLLDYIRTKGYKGIIAVRGDEGIQLATKYNPTGILLDIELPVKNGWEVMDELKNHAATKRIPVHIMSSYQLRRQGLEQGVDFINKPFGFEKMNEVLNRIEHALSLHPRKVMIVEENSKHAMALFYFLENSGVSSVIKDNVNDSIATLKQSNVDALIFDMEGSKKQSFENLEKVRKTPGLENLPVIFLTGKNLSQAEEAKIKQYADSIVVKTAHSYQRILDEISLFLHAVEDNTDHPSSKYKKTGSLEEVLKGKKVLIADDDVRNIYSLAKSLEHYGMKVFSAINGKEALKQMQENNGIQIVLMDMMMPEMDGYEAISLIRQIPQFKNVPVIAVTAKAMTEDREKCIRAGASDYITKPVDIDQLISLLRVWLYQ